MQKKDIIIASAARTPMGHFNGFFKDVSTTTLGSCALRAALERAQLRTTDVQEVIMGCVLPAGLGQAPARQASISAGLSNNVGCTTINKMCGSGMKSVMMAYDTIAAGNYSMVLAGGMENMTRAPYLLSQGRLGYRMGKAEIFDHMILDGLEDAYDKNRHMGYFAEECAKKYNISRKEQDDFAISSTLRALDAVKHGWFNNEITPVAIPTKEGEQWIHADEGPGRANIEKISKLKPAFVKEGTITAANSSSISDGAAALLIMTPTEKYSNQPLARIVGHHTHAQEPAWFSTANIGAIQGLLKKVQWDIQQVDLFEINEAFAVVTLVTMKELQIPHEKINIHGGGCVLGHPIGASGARILVTLIYALKERGLKKGIASICIGGGEATAIAIELL